MQSVLQAALGRTAGKYTSPHGPRAPAYCEVGNPTARQLSRWPISLLAGAHHTGYVTCAYFKMHRFGVTIQRSPFADCTVSAERSSTSPLSVRAAPAHNASRGPTPLQLQKNGENPTTQIQTLVRHNQPPVLQGVSPLLESK